MLSEKNHNSQFQELPPQIQPPPTSAPKPKEDAEQVFGRVIMGILASILVFASILIGYAYLPTLVQAVGLFIIGIGISAVGLYGFSKKRYPSFFLSLAGCGAGIVYLSIFLSYWYFSVVGKWAMYGMLLLWAVLALYISKKQVPLFRLIGQCGIVLSLLFAFRQINALETSLIILFFLFVSAIYQFSDRSIGILPNLSTCIYNIVSLPILTLLLFLTLRRAKAADSSLFPFLIAEGIVLILFTLAQLFWHQVRVRPEEQSGIGYFFAALGVLFLVQVQGAWVLFFWETGKHLLPVLAICSTYLFYDREQEPKPLRILFASFAGICALLWLLFLPAAYAIPGWLLVTALLFGMAKFRNLTAFGYIGYGVFLLGIYLILSKVEFFDPLALQYELLVTVDVLVTLYFRYYRPSRNMEIFSACVTGLLMLKGLSLLWGTRVLRRFEDFGNPMRQLFGNSSVSISNGIPWDVILLTAFVALIFALNVPYLLQRYQTQNGVGVYLGIRATLFGLFAIYAFTSSTIWRSGLLTLLFFGMLLLGFRFSQKELRIYSLVAMLIFLCKLLLLDLSYKTPLLWAGAFLVCGLLCFGISFAYSRIGQRQMMKPENQMEQTPWNPDLFYNSNISININNTAAPTVETIPSQTEEQSKEDQ